MSEAEGFQRTSSDSEITKRMQSRKFEDSPRNSVSKDCTQIFKSQVFFVDEFSLIFVKAEVSRSNDFYKTANKT